MEDIQSVLTIFCGMFSYEDNEIETTFPNSKYKNFEDEIEKNNELQYLKKIFYPNFINLIISSRHSEKLFRDNSLFKHFQLRNCSFLTNLSLIGVEEGDGEVPFSISNVDIFLFPEIISTLTKEKLGIYALHVNIKKENLEYAEISSFIYRMRLFESKNIIKVNEEKYSTIKFIEDYILLKKISFDKVSKIMGNKLKTFTIINSKKNINDIDKKLFDIGTAQYCNSNNTENYTRCSDELYSELVKSNVISIYANWKAISLFDSFTVIGCSKNNFMLPWQTIYFLIYIHCLKMKFYLFYINSIIFNLNSIKQELENIRANFIDFVSFNNLYAISFNILPNRLFLTMKKSLEINNEIDELDKKIMQINRRINEINEKRLNKLIFLLALIGIVSAIYDASEFIKKVFMLIEDAYPHIGTSVTSAIILLLCAYIIYLVRKRNILQ